MKRFYKLLKLSHCEHTNPRYIYSMTVVLLIAMKWPNHNSNKNKPDMYDCRTRPWYTAAANSPKNIVILQDTSGSMTGLRREIAKHVVYTILDTLTDNDYVNVLNFTDETHPVVPCFKDSLIQVSLILCSLNKIFKMSEGRSSESYFLPERLICKM